MVGEGVPSFESFYESTFRNLFTARWSPVDAFPRDAMARRGWREGVN